MEKNEAGKKAWYLKVLTALLEAPSFISITH